MKKYLLAALLLLVNILPLFADDDDIGTPCDPDTPCPIDTWIIVFAVLALIITTVHLHKKQRAAAKLFNS